MESSLCILVKANNQVQSEKLRWMLGDDAPLFEEDVESKWQTMFNALEDMAAPESIENIGDEFTALFWTCGDIDDALKECSGLLTKAGFGQQALYYWADEDEGYLIAENGKFQEVTPKRSFAAESLVNAAEIDWQDEEDQKMIVDLVGILLP